MGKMPEITSEQFDAALTEIMNESPASALLSVPGVYEAVSEHFNNDVLDLLKQRWDESHDDETED